MPRNIQSGWSAPTVIAVDPSGALSNGTLSVGEGTVTSLTAGVGITLTPSNPTTTAGTISNAGVLAINQGTANATGTIIAGSGIILSGNTITAPGGGSVSAVVAGLGLTTAITSTNGTITGSGTLTALESPNAQTGTSYAVAASDRAGLISTSNTASIAATIAQAGTSTFPSGWFADVLNINTGLLTLTPTTSTINGKTTLVLQQNQAARVVSDGSNYFAIIGSPIYIAAGNAMVARSAGNARGPNSVDLQPTNSSMTATQVASGTNAVAVGGTNTSSGTRSIAIGTSNTASGADNSIAVGYSNTAGSLTYSGPMAFGVSNTVGGDNAGAFGYNNSASGAAAYALGYQNAVGNAVGGTFSAALGYQNSITGVNSVGFGYRSRDRGNIGGVFFSAYGLDSTGNSDAGRSQSEDYILLNKTAGATAVRLTVNNAAASSTNVANLGTSQSCTFTVDIIITNTTTGKSATFTVAQSLIEKGANNASTVVTLNGGGVVTGPASSGVFTLAANPTITADTTNGGLNISYTPPVANTDTFYAAASVKYLSLRYN